MASPVSVSGGDVHAGPVSAPIVPLVLTGIGVYLAWFAVHYWGSSTRWPSDPVKAVLTGKPLPAATGQQSAQGTLTAIEQQDPAAPGGIASAVGAATAAPAVAGTYSLVQLEALWTSQGGSSSTAFEAANVAMAESTGRPAVTSPNPDGGTNVGLWQLDTKGKGAGYTVAQLQDPATNARITIMATVNGTTWSGWANPVVSNGVYTGPKV